MLKFYRIILLTLLASQRLMGQVSFDTTISFRDANGNLLDLATAGGLNSAQFNELDLNLDGNMDLVVFDRTSNKINTFIYRNEQYVYEPGYEYLFPNRLINWVLLRDFDCDGHNDLFTSTNLGIKVYRNTSPSNDSITWELIADPIFTLGSSQVNLFVNSSDLPSISDMDGDGDLDILVFNFATGGFIEFHENLSMDNTATCGLEFVRVTREWGDFQECFCGEFAFGGEECPEGSRTLHVSGKALTLIDANEDGFKDVFFGEDECPSLFQLANSADDIITNPSTGFDFHISGLEFLAAYSLRFSNASEPQLLVSTNVREDEFQRLDLASSSFVVDMNSGSILENRFLQSRMIDVGEQAYPALGDLDGDGDQDLIIGTKGRLTGEAYSARLSYFENTGNTGNPTFRERSSDYLGLSGRFTYIKPQIVDVDQDGQLDVVFSAFDGDSNLLYHLPANSPDGTIPAAISHPGTHLDQFELADITGNGRLDLLVASSNGRLDLYENTASVGQFDWQLAQQGFLNIDISPFRTNLSARAGEFDDTPGIDLLILDDSGELRLVSDLRNNSTQQVLNIDGLTDTATRLGRIGSLATGNLKSTGTHIFCGSTQGGIFSLNLPKSSGLVPSDWQVSAFPNPTGGHLNIQTTSEASGSIIALSGQLILTSLLFSADEANPIDLSTLSQGMYILHLVTHNESRQVKFLVRD